MKRQDLSRRQFVERAALGTSALALGCSTNFCLADQSFATPIVVFSKVYQSLKLGFDDIADLTAEAGLQGVDPPVRPGGEVLPERAGDDLLRYAEALRRRKLTLPLLTTAITSTASDHCEEILRAAKKVGAQYYRIGFIERAKGDAWQQQLKEIRSKLKDLAEINRSIGIGAVVQNHSPAGHTYAGGNLDELRAMVEGFNPAEIGVAFDIGHAVVVHGDEWREYFEKLKPHLKVAYVKDAQRAGRWVKFGDGEIGKIGYFTLLRQMGYNAPISMHIEFDWSEQGKFKTREALLKALRDSASTLKGWLTQA